MLVTLAAAAYEVSRLPDLECWAEKFASSVHDAAVQGSDLIVFPEYGLMELSGLFEDAVAGDLNRSIDAIQPLYPRVLEIGQALARKHNLTIIMPSGPVAVDADRFVNRAYVVAPSGQIEFQDKVIMTRFERQWGITGSAPLKLFDAPIGKFGILICYDSEFPLLGRALIERGADILLVPSCTERLAGYHRVRIGASARALEGQCVAVHAPLIGTAPWSEAIDVNQGCAAIYGPPDIGFPDDGVLARHEMNKGGLAVATVSLDAIHHVRSDGAVLNYGHWQEQSEVLAMSNLALGSQVQVVTIR